ncbi:MAG: hypothetical protein FWB77_04795 [Treponema sp.]|nr:hypothetical protein [Treponema sp.]
MVRCIIEYLLNSRKSGDGRKNLILIGIPGYGKTMPEKLAAQMLGIRFFDTDKIFLEKISLLASADIFWMALNGQYRKEN